MTKVSFKEVWVKENLKTYRKMYPDIDKKDLKQFLEKLFDERVQDKKLVIDNNYVKRSTTTSILEVYEWCQDTSPIIAGHGVFFRNQNLVKNPAAVMLKKFLDLRKELKDTMKTFDSGTYEYDTYDRLQLTEKINANSYYGAGGNKHSYFYNVYTATSVTSTGQSLISTSQTSFEQFLTNNVKFLDIDDCRHFINNTLKEKYKFDEGLLPDIPKQKLVQRLLGTFYGEGGEDKDNIQFVTALVGGLTQKEVNRIFFKNNIYAFSAIPQVKEIIVDIFEKVEDFVNPNKIPKNIDHNLNYLWDLYREFVFYNHFAFSRIDRLKYHKRKTVVAVDTDSTMINLDPWVKFVFEFIAKDNPIIESKEYNQVRFAAINSMCFVLTKLITEILYTYTKRCNIPSEYRSMINMKNEFLFSRIILSPVKKRYMTTVRLREGHEIYPEKIDIKGHDFGKSSTRQATKDYFVNMVESKLLNGEINVATIIKELEGFEARVKNSLYNGEKDFLIPKSVKELGAYKDPFKEQGMRAIVAWNTIELNNPIELPAKIDIIKVKMKTLDDCAPLRTTHPEIYKRIERDIFNSPHEKIRKKGIEVIAIPRNLDYIPDWLMPFIDFDTIINDNISRFHSVLAALGISLIKTSGNKHHFSNILHI